MPGNDNINLGQDLRGEAIRQLEFHTQGGKGMGKGLLRGAASDANVRVRHGFSVNDSGSGTRAARHALRWCV